MPQDNIMPTSVPPAMPSQPTPVSSGPSRQIGGMVSAPSQSPVVDVSISSGTQSRIDMDGPSASPLSTVDVYTEVITKIGSAKNVLIALSSDPSVDEIASAIGLSLYLDRLGKRATSIYSGSTPNALEFLNPEKTLDPTADTLQDFVIAINKDKADHLRYKLDGDYVKIYITPYRTRLSEEDLEFSYGDYNVDLVLSLDVANGIDLDSALREHGRIMHDAVIINITTGNPGKFGEIEWSDKSASSISEMVAGLLYNFGGEAGINKDEATAFLTGIVAATNRFSNAKTTPRALRIASKLMESGANQMLVAKNITPDVDNELSLSLSRQDILSKQKELQSAKSDDLVASKESDKPKTPPTPKPKPDLTLLDVEHSHEETTKESLDDSSHSSSVAEGSSKSAQSESSDIDHALLDDLKAAEASLAQTGADAVPSDEQATLTIDSTPAANPDTDATPEPILPTPVIPSSEPAVSAHSLVDSIPTPPVATPEPTDIMPPTPPTPPTPPAPVSDVPSMPAPSPMPAPTMPTPAPVPDPTPAMAPSPAPTPTIPTPTMPSPTMPAPILPTPVMPEPAPLASTQSSPAPEPTSVVTPPQPANPAPATPPAPAPSAPTTNAIPTPMNIPTAPAVEATGASTSPAPTAPVSTSPEIRPDPVSVLPTPTESPAPSSPDATPSTEKEPEEKPELVIQPSDGFNIDTPASEANKYSQMIQSALDSPNGIVSRPATNVPLMLNPFQNPATANTPVTASAPEINGVPEMNYMPTPGAEVLPPPPTPPIDIMGGTPMAPSFTPPVSPTPAATTPATPATPTTPATPPASATPFVSPVPQPFVPAQPFTAPQPSDPGAFKIPGM